MSDIDYSTIDPNVRGVVRWLNQHRFGTTDSGDASSATLAQYARNMRWAAELAGIHGPGTWSELSSKNRP